MIIAGLQKTTLVDYPGKVAATVFTRGCSFRCGFCHNPELVIPEQFIPEIPMEEIRAFFEKRRGRLEAVCITGGEPLMFRDTKEFIHKLKEMGYLVKLDTNGSFPERLEEIIREGEVDYIAMDIKSSPGKYVQVTGIKSKKLAPSVVEGFKVNSADSVILNERSEVKNPVANTAGSFANRTQDDNRNSLSHEMGEGWGEGDNGLIKKITRSIGLIMSSGLDYEFRTTVAKPLHEVEDFHSIGRMIEGAPRYFIQNFVRSKHIDTHTQFSPLSDEELTAIQTIMKEYVGEVGIR